MLLRENWLGWSPAWIPKTLGAFCPHATVWKCLSVQMEKVVSWWFEVVNIPLPCEGMSVSPWVHFKLFQRMRCTKPICGQGKTASPGFSQEVKAFLQKVVQNCSSSEFLLTRASCPTDWNECLQRLTPPGWSYSSLQSPFLTVSKLIFFLFNSKVSFSNLILVCSIQDSHWPWNNLTFFIRCQKQKYIYSNIEKQDAVADSPVPYPHLPHTTGLKIPNDDWIRLEFLLQPIFCTKVVPALFLSNFCQIFC